MVKQLGCGRMQHSIDETACNDFGSVDQYYYSGAPNRLLKDEELRLGIIYASLSNDFFIVTC